MRRIEDEAARMGVLVEDLLTLARLDEVARRRRTSAVDLAALAARRGRRRARDRARPRRSTLDAEPGATVLGDAAPAAPGARQPAAQRARAHAGGHADRGRVAAADGARARSRSATTAPACPTGDPDALFERFWRAEGGRERGRAGAGLGLAIVAAIVDAHGGRVSAANAPGGGAVFTVVLPAAG